ncbi:MAG: DUF6198 family protein [archaeon]|nr:DUF6198 family protein [archaeon]
MGRRIVVLLVGLTILAFGIAMSKKANIGTTPISCIPATLTDCFGLTIGTWTILFNILLVGIEVALLGRNFHPVQVLQIALAFFLGLMTDASMEVLTWLNADSYLEQWFFCVLACVILAFGVMMEIRAKLLVVPGDGLVMALATKVTKYPFHRLKIFVDATMAITACVISLLAVGHLTGAREGTIFAALAVGTFIGFYRARFGGYIDRLLGDSEE